MTCFLPRFEKSENNDMDNTITLQIPRHIHAKLPQEMIVDLESALTELSAWTRNLPKESLFYLNIKPPYRQLTQPIKGITQLDLNIVDTLWDIHSLLVSQLLCKSWRAKQIAAGLKYALEEWNLTVAASMARTLIETTCAWCIESRQITDTWLKHRLKEIKNAEDAFRVRMALYDSSFQMVWGTRQPNLLSKSASDKWTRQRTNIITLIRKAEKLFSRERLYKGYEVLCDAVHPSWGGDDVFWVEGGYNYEINQMRCLLNFEAIGQIAESVKSQVKPGSPLSRIILTEGAWALRSLTHSFL